MGLPGGNPERQSHTYGMRQKDGHAMFPYFYPTSFLPGPLVRDFFYLRAAGAGHAGKFLFPAIAQRAIFPRAPTERACAALLPHRIAQMRRKKRRAAPLPRKKPQLFQKQRDCRNWMTCPLQLSPG